MDEGFKSMSSFFGSSFGDSDFSFGSDFDSSDDEVIFCQRQRGKKTGNRAAAAGSASQSKKQAASSPSPTKQEAGGLSSSTCPADVAGVVRCRHAHLVTRRCACALVPAAQEECKPEAVATEGESVPRDITLESRVRVFGKHVGVRRSVLTLKGMSCMSPED